MLELFDNHNNCNHSYSDGPLPDVMNHVDVPIITNKECEAMYRRAGYIEDIPSIFVCAGLAKGAKDSCEVI